MHGHRIDEKVDFILLLTRTSNWAPRNFYLFVKEQQFMTGKIKPFPNFSFGSNYQVGFSSAHFPENPPRPQGFSLKKNGWGKGKALGTRLPENKLERVANWGSRTCLASPAKRQKELG